MKSQIKVLFICTANACRSQMAEAILRAMAPDRFTAWSAGSHPVGYVHPLAIEVLGRMGVSTEGLRSKGIDEFADQDPDLVITVCRAAAEEACPVWPKATLSVNWPLMDPAALVGSDEERIKFALRIATMLRSMLQELISLDLESLSQAKIRRRLIEIAG